MKNKMRKITAVFLCLCLTLLLVPAISVQADETWEITELKTLASGYDPIPLLVIKINFDANGDGVDDSGNANNAKSTGEQWCHSDDAEWAERCFGTTGKTLKTYYEELTGGKFCFTPCPETSGTANDGIVTVTIPNEHPYKATGGQSDEDYNSRVAALKATDEFVDYTLLDLDGNKKLNLRELAIVYVCGGYEYSSGYGGDDLNVFCVHAHYTTGSGATLDGVGVQGAGFVRIGEYNNAKGKVIANVGTLAHELGHFLGAPDLYDVDKSNVGKTWNYASNLTLMASGSHSAYSGEPNGTSPAYMDPYDMVDLGFERATTVLDGTYTLYSRQSKEGAYNILKINTPNPAEYYLVENRYGTTTDHFDGIADGAKGIQIWHIDELAIASGRVNSEGEGHDPGDIPLGTNGLSSPYGFYRSAGMTTDSYYMFDSTKYKFPISGIAYTQLFGDEADAFRLGIEVLSDRGTEMQVKVTGATALAPTVIITSDAKTTDSLTFRGVIKDLNGGNLTDCGLIFSSKVNPADDKNAVTVHLKPDEYGVFTYTFSGLSSSTKYFCTAFAEGKSGRTEKQTTGYTAAEYVPRDYYIAHLFMGKTDAERSYNVKLHPGELIPVSVTKSMTSTGAKFGYVFGGWYKDEAFTERFDLNSTQTELEDYLIFAKWIPEGSAAILTLANATPLYGATFASEIGSTFEVPAIEDKAGYTFGGWFTDEACTVAYDFDKVIEDLDGLTLWAKWISNAPVETTETTDPPVETTETTIGTEATDETTGSDEPTSGTPIGLIVGIVAVVAVAAVCVVVVIMKKKKGKGES